MNTPAASLGKSYQKSQVTKTRIFAAAATIIARHGYPKASIAKITDEAGVASGLFYYYFKSKDDLLNQVLPAYGEQMIEYIGARVRDMQPGIEREIAAFEAYFGFLAEKPEFYRVFSEASVYSPIAYEAHFRLVTENFVHSLRQQKRHGKIEVAEDQLLALAYSLIGIRNYLTQLVVQRGLSFDALPADFVLVYRRLIAGVFSGA